MFMVLPTCFLVVHTTLVWAIADCLAQLSVDRQTGSLTNDRRATGNFRLADNTDRTRS